MSMANGFPFEQYTKTTYTFRVAYCCDEKPIELKQKPKKHWEHLNKQAYKGGKND